MKTRELSEREKKVVEDLYALKRKFKPANGYITTLVELPMNKWNGEHPVAENTTTKRIPAGSTLKIVMVSRLGDMGLTDNLDAEYGYGLRVDVDSSSISDIRLTPEPTTQ